MTLYELSAQAEELRSLLEADEIDEQTFNDTIEAMGAIDKVENCCKVLQSLVGEEAAFSLEIDRLTKADKTLKNNIKFLKEQIYGFYLANGSQKIKAGTFTVSARKSEYVDITDDAHIPMEYMKVKTEPDKTAIKNALKQGVEMKGVTLQTRESVQIR